MKDALLPDNTASKPGDSAGLKAVIQSRVKKHIALLEKLKAEEKCPDTERSSLRRVTDQTT